MRNLRNGSSTGPKSMTDHQTQDVVGQIVARITAKYNPRMIILFGSHAHGVPHEDSDIDLLVVMDKVRSRRQQATEIDLLLRGIPVPTDVIVATPDDLERSRQKLSSVIGEALSHGKVIHERAAVGVARTVHEQVHKLFAVS